MVKKCVFCGGTKLSKEHIFAQWLLKELNIYEKTVEQTHVNVFGSPMSNRKHAFSRLVNGLVCEECNNGWMSQLESECQAHITNFMNADMLKEEIEYLKTNHGSIAKWVFKNVILLNSAANYRKLVPNEHYSSLYAGNIPDNVFIDLAFCKSDPTLEWRQSPGYMVIREQGMELNLNTSRYTITFQLKHLLFKVVFYESKYNTFYEDEGVIRLFPQFGVHGEPELFKNIDSFDIHGNIREYRDGEFL